MRTDTIYFAFLIFVPSSTLAQYFSNPSFESDISGYEVPIDDWTTCEGTPDLTPVEVFYDLEPTDGNNYVQLRASENSSGMIGGESIGQKLITQLKKDSCYNLTFDIGNSVGWDSLGSPGSLKIYLGDSLCAFKQKIYFWEPPGIGFHSESINFIPEENFDYIVFRAGVRADGLLTYIALDNLGQISECISSTNQVLDSPCVFSYNSQRNMLLSSCFLDGDEDILIFNSFGSLVNKMNFFGSELNIFLNSGVYFIYHNKMIYKIVSI